MCNTPAQASTDPPALATRFHANPHRSVGRAPVITGGCLGGEKAMATVTGGVTRYGWCGQTLCQSRSGTDTPLRRYLAEGEYDAVQGALITAPAHPGSSSIRLWPQLQDGQPPKPQFMAIVREVLICPCIDRI